MDHQKKLDFVLRMTKHALESVQHFDSGGTILPGPVAAGTQNAVNPASQGIAGSIGGFLGTNNNFQATSGDINPGTTTGQLNNAYSGAQGALNQSGNLTSTLTPGVAQGANTQNNLTQQLTAESQGQGPNPAQAALNQNTGQNIAQAAALAASTRGAGTNAGLVASNAANQAANTQQQAVGQEATLEAQQQLSAQNQLQTLASTQVGQGTNAVQLGNQTQQNEQNILQGANTAANNAIVSQQQNINTTNAQVAAGNQQSNSNIISGIGNALGGIGKGIASLFAEGGEVPSHIRSMADLYHPHLASGGMVWQNSTPVSSNISGGSSYTPSQTANPYTFGSQSAAPSSSSTPATAPGTNPTGAGGGYGLGGQDRVDQLGQTNPYGPPVTSDSLSEPGLGDSFIASQTAAPSLALAKGGKVGKPLKDGGKVPGKPKVDHDAYKNDTVSAKLSPGEVVIDLNTLKDKGKLGQMARFVAANIERRKAGRKV